MRREGKREGRKEGGKMDEGGKEGRIEGGKERKENQCLCSGLPGITKHHVPGSTLLANLHPQLEWIES